MVLITMLRHRLTKLRKHKPERYGRALELYREMMTILVEEKILPEMVAKYANEVLPRGDG